MKERPILMSAPMVRAILAGTKTQTRRVVKPQPFDGPLELAVHLARRGHYRWFDESAERGWSCPYGQPGDRLWVRETFQALSADDVDVYRDNWWALCDYKTGKGYKVSYPATDGIKEFVTMDDDISQACSPSIHMPRWASRITLEITGVRVERLQDISEADALAEGINRIAHGREGYFYHATRTEPHPRNWCFPDGAYRELWEQINGPGSWDANPWVWVVEFRRAK